MITGSFNQSPKNLVPNLFTETTMCSSNRGLSEVDHKYKVMKFKANYGYISAMKRIVNQYIKLAKLNDPDTIVLEEVNDDKSKTWIVGNSKDITRMVNDALISPDGEDVFVGDSDHEPDKEWIRKRSEL
jgi:hypothetical protein